MEHPVRGAYRYKRQENISLSSNIALSSCLHHFYWPDGKRSTHQILENRTLLKNLPNDGVATTTTKQHVT